MPAAVVITEVDPFDDAATAAWWDAMARGQLHGRETTGSVFQLEEFRPMLQQPSRVNENRAYAALLGDRVVATAWVTLPLLDNLTLAELAIGVPPEARRSGHGSALLAQLEVVLRAAGRSVIEAQVAWAHDAGPTGRGSAGVEFALARGFTLGLAEVQRQLVLPVSTSLLDELAASAAPHHTAYSLVSFSGPLPEEYLRGWCELDSSLLTEAPLGDLEREPMAVDLAGQREAEARIAAQGRTKHTTLALTDAGEVVAYSDAAMTVHEPGRAYQWGTLVRADHRGHRLGTAVKVANLRHLQAAHPELRVLFTWNAESNSHMIGVNELLGFTPTERSGSFQKRLLQDAVVDEE